MTLSEDEVLFDRPNLRFSARYDFIIYPLDFAILRKVLQKQDYRVVKSPGQQDIVSGGIVEIDGTIAGKDELTVDSLGEKQVLGMNGKDIQPLTDAFKKLEGALSEEIGEALEGRAKFYETIIHYVVKTQRNPLEVFASMSKVYPYSSDMGEILGEKIAPYCYKVSPAGTPIDSKNWFEFNIEPLVSRAASSYHISLVYRNQAKQKVIRTLTDSKSIAVKALSLLEGQSSRTE